MTLLETITRAAAEADAGTLTLTPKFAIPLNSAAILPNLKPDSDSPPPPATAATPLIKRVTGWKPSDTDAAIDVHAAQFSQTLKRKLRTPRPISPAVFKSLLNTFLFYTADKIGLPIGTDQSDPAFTSVAIEKLGFLINREVASLIAEACINVELWGVLDTVIRVGLIGNSNSSNLIAKLVEKNRPDLLSLCVRHIPDLRSADLVAILKCFLSPTTDCYKIMVTVRKRWESEARLAVEKATQKREEGVSKKVRPLAKEAAILLMMAHDGFSSSEICLHYAFGSGNLDGLMLGSAISKLDGAEVLALVCYFKKWVEKYERFPEAVPCPKASSMLGLWECENVPSLEAVVSGLGLVLDEHFSYLVLNPEFHDEIKALEKVVGSLASEAGACCPVDDIVKRLRSDAGKR